MVVDDLMQSNMVIEAKLEQYIKFMNVITASQKKAFGLKQMYDKMSTSSSVSNDNMGFIKLKVNKFNQKNTTDATEKEDISTTVTQPMSTQPNGVYDRVKGYLFNTTNGLLGLFGLSLTSK
jgi:hypothetical protein